MDGGAVQGADVARVAAGDHGDARVVQLLGVGQRRRRIGSILNFSGGCGSSSVAMTRGSPSRHSAGVKRGWPVEGLVVALVHREVVVWGRDDRGGARRRRRRPACPRRCEPGDWRRARRDAGGLELGRVHEHAQFQRVRFFDRGLGDGSPDLGSALRDVPELDVVGLGRGLATDLVARRLGRRDLEDRRIVERQLRPRHAREQRPGDEHLRRPGRLGRALAHLEVPHRAAAVERRW